MGTTQTRYDADQKLMWVYRSFPKPKTLVPEDELQKWIDALKAGETPEGDELELVRYVFPEEETAEYNHQALTYARIGTFLGDLDNPVPFEAGDEPNFETREDFGIE